MKRSAAEPALKKAKKVAAPKQSQPELPPVACIISGLHAECKIAVAKCLLQELEAGRAVLLTTDAAAAKKALPGSKVRQFSGLSKSAGLLAKSLAGEGAASASLAATSFADFDVLRASFAGLPAALRQLSRGSFASFLPPNVVALAHELAHPDQVTEALAGGAGAVRLVTVVDGRSFLDDWEEGAMLPPELMAASPGETRKTSDVLADHIESADVIVLATAGDDDEDEVAMMEGMLRALNPSATVLRRADGGAGGGALLPRLMAAEAAAPAEARAGWRQVRSPPISADLLGLRPASSIHLRDPSPRRRPVSRDLPAAGSGRGPSQGARGRRGGGAGRGGGGGGGGGGRRGRGGGRGGGGRGGGVLG